MSKAFQFENKVVYLISPQNWGVMKVSKHHYALELAERGNRVFFIEPPNLAVKGVQIRSSEEHPNLFIVNYKPVFRGKRFLPSPVFKLMIRVQIWLIIQKIGLKPDLVWSFSGFLFENLKWFGASKSIFFAADLFEESALPSEVFSADIVLGVSNSICTALSKSGVNVHFINHGLNKFFEKEALQKLGSSLQTIGLKNSFDKIKVGYVGNLRMEAIDRETMKSLIQRFKDLQFIFWGSYDQKDANLGGITNLETEDWIVFLKQQSNVELRGTVSTERLAIEIQDVDLFWICWKIGVTKAWDGSNSHKILEYLSTGKPIVSHFVSTYKDSTLFYMLSETKNTNYEALFNSVLDRVKINESSSLVENRIKYSLSNTYHSHLNSIESLLSLEH